MSIEVYLNFNGNTREAVEYYARVFNAPKPTIMTYGEMPPNPGMPLDENTKQLILHANIKVFDSTLMFSDAHPKMPVTFGNNMSITVNSPDPELIRSSFDKLASEGKVIMELQETFWSKCYGNVTDKFGVGWQFNLEEQD
ncbi:MAG: VOC family protein [Clostridiales bacterium]|nr:VOC family protein [Clostridiales bacterium]